MNDYSEIIARAAAKHGVDPELIRKVIEAESSGNPTAASPKGAQGLMQLMPDTAKEMGVTDPNDPEQNIMGGTHYFSNMMQKFGGDKRKALAAYNWGPTNVMGGGAYPPETTAYLDKILGGAPPAMPTSGPTTPPGPPPGPKVASTDVPPVMPRRPYPQPAPPPPALVDQAAPGTAAQPPTRTASAEPEQEMYRPMGPVGPSFPKALVDRGKGAFNRAVSGVKNAMAPMTGPAPVQAAPKDFPLAYAGDEERMPPEEAPVPPTPAPTVPVQPKSGAMDMLMQYIRDTPQRKDYRPGTLGKIGTVLAGGLSGWLEGPEASAQTVDRLLNGGYNRALQEHGAKFPGISLAARTEDQNYDRALREREVASTEKYHNAMGAAATERADKYGTAAGRRGGPQQRVPVGQQTQAWQTAAERLYVTDPSVRKYLTKIEGKNGPSYVPATEVERWGFNRNYNAQELEEVKRVLDRIDQEAQQYIGKMVDPYDRSHPSGFGAQQE